MKKTKLYYRALFLMLLFVSSTCNVWADHTVTFDVGDYGTCSTTSLTVSDNGSIASLPDVSLKDFAEDKQVFLYWKYTRDNGSSWWGPAYSGNSFYNINSDLTFKACYANGDSMTDAAGTADALQWAYDSGNDYNDGMNTLYVKPNSGVTSAAMPNFASADEVPWNSHVSDIKAVKIYKGVTSIGDYAFSGCTALEQAGCLDWTNSVTTIGKHAFDGCTSLQNQGLGEKITEIGDYAYNGCTSLRELGVEEITKIGDYAYNGCTKLDYLNFKNTQTIGSHAFYGCSEVSYIEFNSFPNIGTDAFTGISSSFNGAYIYTTEGNYVGTSENNYPEIQYISPLYRTLQPNQEYGTIVVPFPLKNNSEDYTLGYVSAATTSAITVTDYPADKVIEANTPVFFKAKSVRNEEQTLAFSPSETKYTPSATFKNSCTVDNWKMAGSYNAITAEASKTDNITAKKYGNDDTYSRIYYISTDNTFYYANVDFPSAGFRGWLLYKGNSNHAKALNIAWNDSATAISSVNDEQSAVNNGSCYNLAGQRVNADTKGIVIMNGKKHINK